MTGSSVGKRCLLLELNPLGPEQGRGGGEVRLKKGRRELRAEVVGLQFLWGG